ncbi:MAG: hypothetical protein PVJ02_04310, partial [Gemmatimonadota bacterium]
AAVRAHLTRTTGVAVALWLVTVAAWILVAAWAVAGPEGWRQGSDVPLLLDAAFLVLLAVVLTGLRGAAARWFAEAPLSEAMERASGVEAGLVRGSLELARAVPPGVSPSLVGRAAERTLESLDRPVPTLAGTLGVSVRAWTRRAYTALAVTAVVLAGLAVVTPERSGRAWGGLVRPLGLMVDPSLAPVVLEPGTVEVPRGSDVEVRVRAPGRATADLAWQAAGDVGRTETLVLDDGVGVKVFPAVSATVEYRARTPDGAVTEAFRIVPVDPLFVSDLRLEVAYPPHTGMSPEEYRGTVPPLRLPMGTRLTVDGRASRPLSRAALTDTAGGDAFVLDVEEGRFEGTWEPRRGGRFVWDFLGGDGTPAEVQPDPLELTLLPDSAPLVSIPLPGRDTLLPLDLKQPLILEARDDYGLRRLELVAYRVTSFGAAEEPVVQGLDLGGTRAAMARPLLDLGDWGLLPGDEVHYFARAIDNAPAAHTGRSREFVLRMPLASELRRDAEKQLGDVAERLKKLAEEAGKKAAENRDLQRQEAAERQDRGQQRPGEQGKGEEADFEQREQLKKALEDQDRLTSQVDSMRAEMEALEETMREAGQADPELRKDLEELQKLLEQIAGDDLKERLKQLSEGLDQEDAREANQKLQELSKEQEDFRDRLEKSLERFRRAAVDQDFRATRSEADELAKQQKALADAMKEGDNPELRQKQQEKLQKETDELQSRMDQLQERLEQLEERDAAREVSQAREKAAEAGQQQEAARQQARQQQGQQAGEKADQAAQALQKTAEQLDQAQQQMAQQKAQATMEALKRASDDALSLARRQAQLGEDMSSASQDEITAMRADEASLIQGVRNLAQNLQTGSDGEALAGNQEMAAQIGRAMASIQRTIQAMENRRGSAPSPRALARGAVDDLNQLALMAIAGTEQGGSKKGQAQNEEQVSEQLEQLAQEQGDLSNQTGQLTPLQLGEQALKRQLEELARQQQSVGENLEDLSQKDGAKEQSLGDLNQLAAEAQALAQQMARGRLTPDMVRRQERLFHRLLDAGRSLKREDEEVSDERESKAPGAFERADVLPLGADELGALRFQMPDAERMQQLPPAVRQLVIQYFERLNGGGGASDAPARPGGGS